MKRQLSFVLLCLMLTACRSSAPANGDQAESNGPLTISAAASLKDALTEIAAVYKQQTGRDVVFSFGASGTLQKQIETGAGVDIFASAGSQQMDALAAKQLIDNDSRHDFAGNELVLIVPEDSKLQISTIEQLAGADVKRIAAGNPKTVPAGRYAQQVFSFAKFDDAFQKKLVLAEDVRQVLDYVVRGEVDAGLVYKTDAMVAGDKVKVAATAPDASHDPIRYPVAMISDSSKKEEARKFIDVLMGADGQAILKKYGFVSVQ